MLKVEQGRVFKIVRENVLPKAIESVLAMAFKSVIDLTFRLKCLCLRLSPQNQLLDTAFLLTMCGSVFDKVKVLFSFLIADKIRETQGKLYSVQ